MQLSQQKISPEVLRSCCVSGAVSLSCLRTHTTSWKVCCAANTHRRSLGLKCSRQSLYNKRGDILYHNLYNRSGVTQYTVSYTSIQGACLIGIGHRMSGLAYHIIFIFLNQVKAMSVVLDEEHQRQKKLISLLLFV